MKFEGVLERGELVKRYKRFLADVKKQDGSVVTIHCPNTGSMKNCAEPGFGVWFSESDNKKLKLGTKKRETKLTVSRALSDEIEARERSLASVKRARLKEKKINPDGEKKEFKEV